MYYILIKILHILLMFCNANQKKNLLSNKRRFTHYLINEIINIFI